MLAADVSFDGASEMGEALVDRDPEGATVEPYSRSRCSRCTTNATVSVSGSSGAPSSFVRGVDPAENFSASCRDARADCIGVG